MDLSTATTKAATFWNRYYPNSTINTNAVQPTIFSTNTLQPTSNSSCNNTPIVIPITLGSNTNNSIIMTQQENFFQEQSIKHLYYQNYNHFPNTTNSRITENRQNQQQNFCSNEISEQQPTIICNKNDYRILENNIDNNIKSINKINSVYSKKNKCNQNFFENGLAIINTSTTQSCSDRNNNKNNTTTYNSNNVAFDVAARLCSVATIYASRILIRISI